MKKIVAIFLGLAIAAMSQFALAAPAVVAELIGTAQRIPDGAAPIALKKGDSINERDTVQTGASSAVVLRFEDGQTSALGANTRMTVSAYTYDVKEPAKSNVLLSLLTGGMRAVTGLIGKARPDKVAFRAGTATIGIRGTDVTFATSGGDVVVTVVDGSISFTFAGGAPVVVTSGNGVLLANGQLTQAGIAAINAAVANVPGLSNALAPLNNPAIINAVTIAAQASLVPPGTTPPATVTCGASCN